MAEKYNFLKKEENTSSEVTDKNIEHDEKVSNDEDIVRILGDCNHIFHITCCDIWKEIQGPEHRYPAYTGINK